MGFHDFNVTEGTRFNLKSKLNKQVAFITLTDGTDLKKTNVTIT